MLWSDSWKMFFMKKTRHHIITVDKLNSCWSKLDDKNLKSNTNYYCEVLYNITRHYKITNIDSQKASEQKRSNFILHFFLYLSIFL